jgi:hypothetical protein
MATYDFHRSTSELPTGDNQCRGREAGIPALYSAGTEFNPRPGDQANARVMP